MRIAWNPSLASHLQAIPRTHPWTTSAALDEARYYDFRAEPHLIRTALEDFRELGPYPAGARFYELIEWLNEDSSAFETNDCLLRLLHDAAEGVPRVTFRGHITFFLRDVARNAQPRAMERLCNRIGLRLDAVDTAFDAGALDFAVWPTLFAAAPVPFMGGAVHLRFSAWGGDVAAARDALARLFTNLATGLRLVSEDVASDDWLQSEA